LPALVGSRDDEIIGDIRGAPCGLSLRWPEFDLRVLPRIERGNEHAAEIGVFLCTAVRRVERQIDMERMRPKIVDKVAAELADPPEGHILGVVGEADRSRQQIARGRQRFGSACLEREVEEGKRPTDRRVQDGRDCIVRFD
jgi:hypothetical protein